MVFLYRIHVFMVKIRILLIIGLSTKKYHH